MSRFFKSAAFPILIVVVLAFFAQKLISGQSRGANLSYSGLVSAISDGQVKSLNFDQK
jgi:cell division protease FtsH